ncbi:hypothetical protein [Rhizobium sp. IMFF44]|uniref:hypothetical protein n=1 Tax=Rhizobium sp. IMFF44 TaxID=3342350 RepID=UPI0035BB2CA4
MAERHRAALAAWDDVPEENWYSESEGLIETNMLESRRALLDFRPTAVQSFYAKSEAMLSFRSISEWDEAERSDLIQARKKTQDEIGKEPKLSKAYAIDYRERDWLGNLDSNQD